MADEGCEEPAGNEGEHDSCPVPNTHRRLEQAHRIWHQAMAAYFDPDGFQTNLNSVIDALRNVTFMLQSEKTQLPGFDDWYKPWQERLKGDSLVRWLADARTTVVHRSDLETYSFAKATVHHNIAYVTTTIKVPPFLPTVALGPFLAERLPRALKKNKKDLVLSIERQWCVEDLPDNELLDVLAHGYGALSQLVRDAHLHVGRSYETVDVSGRVHSTPDGRSPCMITTRESRTVRLKLEDGRQLIPHVESVVLDRGSVDDDVGKRYGIDFKKLKKAESPSFVELAESMLELAKRMLVKDKYLRRTMFLRGPTGLSLMGIEARDRAEKYAITRAVADQVRAEQVDAIIDIGEAWTSSLAEMQAGRMPEDARDRGEIIWVTVVDRSGAHRRYQTPFRRTFWGAIKLGETTVAEGPPPAYLTPIL